MKYQALFYQKNNEKYSKLSSAAVVIGALRVKHLPLLLPTGSTFGAIKFDIQLIAPANLAIPRSIRVICDHLCRAIDKREYLMIIFLISH